MAIVVATFIAAGAVGASAIRGKTEGRAERSTETKPVVTRTVSVTLAAKDSTHRDSTPAPAPVPQTTQAAAPTTPATQPVAAPPVVPRPNVADQTRGGLTPVVPAGQSDLAGGVTAMRGDSDVVVAFDTPEARTRRPEKFEQFVRTTLPLVYGNAMRNVLARIPDGTIVGQGELLTELPKRGVRIPLDGAWSIRLYPETRPGQDGPLVIRYRVAVVPTTE